MHAARRSRSRARGAVQAMFAYIHSCNAKGLLTCDSDEADLWRNLALEHWEWFSVRCRPRRRHPVPARAYGPGRPRAALLPSAGRLLL